MLRHITSSSHVGRSQFSRLSTSAQYTGAPAAVSNFIDGVSTTVPSSNQTLENVNPATGQVISTLPRSNASDVEAAVAAAQRAAPVVRAMPLAARAALLERVANIIEVHTFKKNTSRCNSYRTWETRENDMTVHFLRCF
jgi:acyl-CoA reductase-like NAD-dependent aldehyde dehydrogenase